MRDDPNNGCVEYIKRGNNIFRWNGVICKLVNHSLCILVCNAALNFCGDSFSHINCFGRCINVMLITGVGTGGLVY